MPNPGEIRANPKNPSQKAQWNGSQWVGIAAPDIKDPQYKEAAAAIGKERTAYLGHATEATDLTHVADLLKRVTTGGFFDQPSGEKDMVNLKQLRSVVNPDYNDLQNVSARLQIGNKPEGQDAQVTNFERELFSAGSPSVSNHNNVNAGIIGKRQGLLNQQNDKIAFLEDYLNTHGNLAGAAEKWTDYTTKHPYFGPSSDPKKKGQTVSYYGRPVGWRDYVYGKQTNSGAPVAPPAKKRPPLSDIFGQ